MEKGINKQKLPLLTGERQKLRERTWMPAFHLFGFETELAFTFQPPLSAFQFAFTAQSRFVPEAIRATAHRVLSGLYFIWSPAP